MFRLRHNNKGSTSFQGQGPACDQGKPAPNKFAHLRNGDHSDFLLTNILEEASSIDEPRNFEQEEKYLNECLKAVSDSVEDVQCSEAEEYDFDDFNSIASTTSLLNLNTEPKHDNKTKSQGYPPRGGIPKFNSPVNGALSHLVPHGNGHHVMNGHSTPVSKERISSYQKSISKVEGWEQLGRSATREDWKQVLLRAAEAGDLITVQDAVSHLGATKESLVHARDIAGNTPLHRAAQGGKLQCLQWLAKHAPPRSVAIGNHEEMTPAAMATQFGQYECLAWLLETTEAGAELEKGHCFCLVHYAAQAGQQECLKYLLVNLRKQNRPLDICDSNGVTPAHLAAREGHLLCLQVLVDFNADITLKDKDGWTAADYAYKAGHLGCAKYLAVVESCLVLSERVSSVTKELMQCRKENAELRKRVEVLEDRSQTSLPCRPEALGGDQSDSSSTTSVSSVRNAAPVSSRQRRPEPAKRRDSTSPDGESPRNADNDREFFESASYSHDHTRLRSKSVTSHLVSTRDIRRHSMPEVVDQKYLERQYERASVPGYQVTSTTRRQLPLTPAASSKKSPPPPPPRSSSRSNPVSRASSGTTPSIELTPDRWTDARRRSSSTADGNDSSRQSSRSQSPYRSDRSTSSSADTVLDAKMLGNKNNYVRSRDVDSMQAKGPWGNRLFIAERGNGSSESPFSSDSDVEHTFEKRKDVREHPQVTVSKENLRRIHSEVKVSDNVDTPLRTSKPTNPQARFSWHGVSGKIATLPSRTARDTGVISRTPHGQQAHVIWNGSPARSSNVLGKTVVATQAPNVDRQMGSPKIPHDTSGSGKPVMRTNSVVSSSSFTLISHDAEGGDSRPWYEIDDEIDL